MVKWLICQTRNQFMTESVHWWSWSSDWYARGISLWLNLSTGGHGRDWYVRLGISLWLNLSTGGHGQVNDMPASVYGNAVQGHSLSILHTLPSVGYTNTNAVLVKSYCGLYCVMDLVIFVIHHPVYAIYYHQMFNAVTFVPRICWCQQLHLADFLTIL